MNVKALMAAATLAALAAGPTLAQPVTTGVMVRGVSLSGPMGAPGTATGRVCDFSNEETTPTRGMAGASVQCRANGNLTNTLPGLPARFNAYCAPTSSRVGGRVIAAPVVGNTNHCDLSGITPRNATVAFGGAVWR